MSLDQLTVPEVDFERTGLETVICQLRFDPILRISTESPARFQELVRGNFPKIEVDQEAVALHVTIGSAEGSQVAEGPRPEGNIWQFSSEDEKWKASLASGFLSLETSEYKNFPDLEKRFGHLHGALQTSGYPIDDYTRIGLRYVNVFGPDEFPGDWRELINPGLLGAAADEILGASIQASRQRLVIAEDDWTITFQHGTDERGYRIDIDHATTTRVGPDQVEGRLRIFNARIFQLFRWAISGSLYEAMGPKERNAGNK